MSPLRNVARIVENQVQTWGQAERKRAEQGATARVPRPITISREYGALGAALGRIVSERLAFGFWDQEILQAIAKESGAREAILASLDERKRGYIDDLVEGATGRDRFSEGEFVRHLFRLVQTIAAHGSAVIIGRGANLILGPSASFRVRTVCPLEDRVRRLAAAQGLGDATARAEITRVDAERAAFVRRNFGEEVGDASSYDVVINTGTLSLEAAAELVIGAYRAQFR
ncbi:MAG: cytidylate kinase-like family protein [Deltaproteobacteria bacterium]|nr:cytidylate kinase-like family protein [Deltaproteobacteria bacterium]